MCASCRSLSSNCVGGSTNDSQDARYRPASTPGPYRRPGLAPWQHQVPGRFCSSCVYCVPVVLLPSFRRTRLSPREGSGACVQVAPRDVPAPRGQSRLRRGRPHTHTYTRRRHEKRSDGNGGDTLPPGKSRPPALPRSAGSAAGGERKIPKNHTPERGKRSHFSGALSGRSI